ncbi:hypothetical protein KP509_07G055400 [Ceratopteris richardii]|uniref:Uncharacterized protein n=1 Tax=Ceratopteris richardii TaxID=49495 RepID=A0A8T2UA35_CERRI|nr:hypothetical protein KP509_07G055400 [Ceratopteris richardii]KAH7433115.1 hypothetical protein KP509_07G055400 [Ceratopteris richardii]KAH7433119.1 hypothetical protein KP509_07G055400 [Ceratopteris richardii]KAH7433121.1 hypothetical protein KP509_07G055400 [Ceratopteris richardii]KAH7433123.1 hypothetical protein KP509_07G055400 [Ceratopteris richardii]
MNRRCYVGTLRSLLESLPDDEYGIQNAVINKVQRELITNSLLNLQEDGNKFHLDVQDCAVVDCTVKVCVVDLQGLMSNLVYFLASDNIFTKHLAGKAFAALFRFLHGSVSLWVILLSFIWNALKECFSCDDAVRHNLLKENISSADLSMESFTSGFGVAMNLFGVLHNTLKTLKQEPSADLELFCVYSKDDMAEVLRLFCGCAPCLLAHSSNNEWELGKHLVTAAVLRFICSFVHGVHSYIDTEHEANFFGGKHLMASIINFLEAFSQHCLQLEHPNNLHHYLRYKFLMLMFQMCDWFSESPSLASTCSTILRTHISSLCPSLFVQNTSLSASSLSSPFAACILQSITQNISSLPVHRPEKHAIFLIFKLQLSFTRIPPSGTIQNTGCKFSCLEEPTGQWMYHWLLSQLRPSEHHTAPGNPVIANALTSCFLQNFMDEDILLLEILVLLHDYSLLDLSSGFFNDNSSEEAHTLLIEVFKPIRLFAVFLSLISYDHSVILDFLIGKDTSILCLKYLLRSLRIVRSSWPEFLLLDSVLDREAPDVHNSQNPGQLQSSTTCTEISVHHEPLEIRKVGACLLELRHTVERLHERHAFPYDPTPFLKHLHSFEQLWLESLS